MDVEQAQARVTELADDIGRPLSKEDHLALCEELAAHFEACADATREELDDERDAE